MAECKAEKEDVSVRAAVVEASGVSEAAGKAGQRVDGWCARCGAK